MNSRKMEEKLKEWMPLFDAQKSSGLNKREWCKQNNVHEGSFFKWQRRCREYVDASNFIPISPIADNAAFVEICSSSDSADNFDLKESSSTSTDKSSIIIKYGDFAIELNDEFEELHLAKVLRAMKNA